MTFVVKPYNQVNQQKWDDFVFANSMGWAYFLYDMIAFHRYKSYINRSFAIIDDNQNIFMLIMLYETESQHLLSDWGFLVRANLTRKQEKELKQTFQKFMDNFIANHNITNFSIQFPPLCEQNLPINKIIINPCIFYNFTPSIRYTYVIDLSKTDEKMLSDCEETTRQVIRKHDKSNQYEIYESQGTKKDCQIYIDLHKETYTRTNAKEHIIHDEYNKNIFYTLIPKKICRVFFLKNKESGVYIATVAILIYNKTAYYWWGSSKDDKEVGVNKYLLFKVICIIRESFQKTGYFETGSATPYLRNGNKFKGLNDYKKSFGTFLHPIFTGSYEKPFTINETKQYVIRIFGYKILSYNKLHSKLTNLKNHSTIHNNICCDCCFCIANNTGGGGMIICQDILKVA